MGRVKGEDTPVETIVKMAEGNPGAATVMANMLMKGMIIGIFALDELEIYGPSVWVAYKDCCGSDLDKLNERLEKLDTTLLAEIDKAMNPDWMRNEPVN